MAYVNVAEWKTDQVCEWLKGLDNSVLPYVHSFTNHSVNGQQLLNLRPEDLEHLGVLKLGHQEIILEAVEYLRNFHYELDRENLQLLALRLSCQAYSLHNELCRQTDSKPVTTQTLSDVASVVTAVKPLVRWLDRPPFSGQLEYNDKKAELLKLSLEMATCAQRDRFADKPIEEIRTTCGQLAKLADYIIRDIADPMILQPASLDLATLKKRPGDDLGFYILPSFHGAHQVAEIKFGSAAHQCGKMEEGDEIVQVNYQTVVGWERKNVLELFRESPAEVLLTLKRRPRHTKVYGQIYIKPYRLPSNKKTPYTTRWQHNLPSPRPELLTIPDFTMPLPRNTPKDPSPEPTSILDTVNMLDTMITDSSDSDSEVDPPSSVRLYSTKPRNLVQRRATITGASPTTKHSLDLERFWRELKQEHSTSFQLRDKAASCAHGLDNVPSSIRPQTCMGIEQSKRRKKVEEQQLDEKKVHFQEKSGDVICTSSEESEKSLKDWRTVDGSKDDTRKNEPLDPNQVCCQNSTNVDINNINVKNNASTQQANSEKSTEVVNDGDNKTRSNTRRKERGKLDKSHSTPAYDLTEVDFLERKTATLENRPKFRPPTSMPRSVPSIISKKTDSQENAESCSNEIDNSSAVGSESATGVVGANKVECNSNYSDVDRKQSTSMASSSADLVKSVVHIKVSDVDEASCSEVSQSNSDSITHPVNNTCGSSSENHRIVRNRIDRPGTDPETSEEGSELNRESSNEKTESTESYNEGTGSSSEGDVTFKKFGAILQTIDCALMEHSRLIEKKALIQASVDNMATSTEKQITVHNTSLKPNSVSDIQIPQENQSTPPQCSCSSNMNSCCRNYGALQTCTCSGWSKNKAAKKPEIKPRLTPPEPPPRKYFTKPAPLNLNLSNSPNLPDTLERPKAPQKPSTSRELGKVEQFVEQHKPEGFDTRHKNDHLETYREFVEKSMDFIDEPTTPINECSYTEIFENQLKDDRNRYDKFDEDRSNGMSHFTMDRCRSECLARNADSPDGVGCSRQNQSPDLKTRTIEKDKHPEKGVVNRAMMVARSIGLPGTSNKSSGSSPRISRKRNMLLAKRRNVSVKDIGAGDLEGWLTYRSRGAGGAWARAWFILKGSFLYRFKTQDSTKADCLIALTGFTGSQAAEVKSRKFAFKVYHTGTVFYFATDAEDSLGIWLDAINKATLGTDSHSQISGLFSETDESDCENKSRTKGVQTPESKPSREKICGSLKKATRKEPGFKEHEMSGASLDRKYLRFLGARNQNVPVPTAQFRSYRRVLPTSTPNRKQESIPNIADMQVTVAGSTFYGLSSSQSASDVPTSQEMADYRRTADRSQSTRERRPDEISNTVTLEEFVSSSLDEERPRTIGYSSSSSHTTPLTSDHVHVKHRNFDDGTLMYDSTHSRSISPSNGVPYGQNILSYEDRKSMNTVPPRGLSRTVEDVNAHNRSLELSRDQRRTYSQEDENGMRIVEKSFVKLKQPGCLQKKSWQPSCTQRADFGRQQQDAASYAMRQKDWSRGNDSKYTKSWSHSQSGECLEGIQSQIRAVESLRVSDARIYGPTILPRPELKCHSRSKDFDSLLREPASVESIVDVSSTPRKLVRNDGYSGSSSDLACRTSSETLQRTKKEALLTRKGSFNLIDRRDLRASADKHWVDSLRRIDRHENVEKNRLKNVAQYQPPPIPNSPFEPDGMRPAFEMHLDKSEHVQKPNRFKSLFGSRSPQKPNTLDLPKEPQKTLLGSPRLHRALFRDKTSSQQDQKANRSNSQSPGDSGISRSLSSFSGASQSQTLSRSFSSISSASDWSPDTPTLNPVNQMAKVPCSAIQTACKRKLNNTKRNSLTPPTLPYIPPPTSPPPDYPGLEYPPVFEPGTYSLTDASLLRMRNKSQNNIEQ
ncbi:uncharacterized protein LOC105701420 [Orussus abietinus]|uniref:uncharacterized protein LOC105701420 n=1 Tax=Orussus abietinus TaxID=222816 RepID=UPI00062616D0|nr:uncharacterized protein LOC105701420 [Orussus abietinus]